MRVERRLQLADAKHLRSERADRFASDWFAGDRFARHQFVRHQYYVVYVATWHGDSEIPPALHIHWEELTPMEQYGIQLRSGY